LLTTGDSSSKGSSATSASIAGESRTRYTSKAYGNTKTRRIIVQRLEGKRAIVTGAGSGIGRAIAVRLSSEGAWVTLADVDEEAAKGLASELGSKSLARRLDVSKAAEVEALVRSVGEEWGGLDVMVNNAGIGVAATAPDTSEEDFDRQMDVNLKGAFFGIKYAVPAMRDSGGGSIINMSSVAALVGVPDRAAYCAAKGAILALTRAAAIDHVGEGVRVNCIAPGTVDTPWIGRITAGYEDPEEARARMQARQPHGRFVEPEEIAAMAAYLASDESASVIGACMVVDGGMTAR
jgi:NAD(P)-dependent dehydrogenase (short-subunit alcohol dehydrogenase family)